MGHQAKNAVMCAACAFLPDCGGLLDTPSLWGCYSECMLTCNPDTCDLTCPNNHRLFVHRLAEIGGSFHFASPELKVPTLRLPKYVTKIHNGSSRQTELSMQVVALPVRELLCKSGANVSCRFRSPDQVRRFFGLGAKTAYIISCISVDEDVEMVWNGLKYGRLGKELARIKPAAIIVPNFSFFTNVPRPHTLYNRKRIGLAAHLLSEAGCRVIIPLNALTAADWDFWYELLRANPAMRYVVKEFQTGLSCLDAAHRAIEQLAQIQDRLGRLLHPVAFAAARFRTALSSHFDSYTIIDSRPFMQSVYRRRVLARSSGSSSEVFSPTAPGAPLDELMQANIRERKERLG